MFHSTVNPSVPAAGAESGNSTPRRPRLAAAAEDEFGNKIRRPSLRSTERHAEAEEVFGVHGKIVYQFKPGRARLFHQRP